MKAYTFVVLAVFGAIFWGSLIDLLFAHFGEGASNGDLPAVAAAMLWTCFVRPLGRWILSRS